MNIIYPLTVTTAMVKAGTTIVAEDSTPAWVTGTNYTIGTEVHVVATHKVYRDAVGGVSSVSPELAPLRWGKGIRPTNRWAPFDWYADTKATATGSLTYVLQPGYFNALGLYGLVGDGYAVTVKDAPGGTVMFSQSGALEDAPLDWYEWLFAPVVPLTQLVFTDIDISPTAELTVTISSSTGGTVGLGMLTLGDYLSLMVSEGEVEGVEQGCTLEPITNSYVDFDEYGALTIQRRPAATNLRAQIVLHRNSARYAVWVLRKVMDTPVAVVLADEAGLEDLTTFGLINATVAYRKRQVDINATIKGIM